MTRHLRRLLAAGLLAAPAALAAALAWWTRIPDPPGAATWAPQHQGGLDSTGLFAANHAREVEANLQAMREERHV